MKKFASLILAVIFICSSFSILAAAVDVAYTGTTSAKTPTGKCSLKFSKKLGEGYAFAPTAPVVSGKFLIVLSGNKLYKLKTSNGDVAQSAVVYGKNTYTTVSPCVADGKIFVQLDGGVIRAFDFETLKSLWVYTDPLGGQSLCNIVYSGGCIYTGFWNGETQNANYVCITTKDENTKKTDEAKKAKWSFKSSGGFYWADACVTSKLVIFGSDDGEKDSIGSGKVYALDKASGKKLGSLKLIGDLRSGVVYDSSLKRYFISSKSGYIFSFAVSSKGKFSGKKTLKLAGSASATPAIYNGRIYMGSSDGSTGGKFYVINGSTLKEIYHEDLSGYPQASPLLSTAYERDGKVYIYQTLNSKPGPIYMFTDSKGQTKAEAKAIFTPDEKFSQYCISRIFAGNDGTLYYKNDSGNIFAVTQQSGNFIINLINRIIAFFAGLLGAR